MKITAIKAQVKNPERVSIFVDDQYSFSLSLSELLEHKLKNGDELNPADVKRFKKISADGKLRLRAVEWLLNRPRSTREFNDYLYRKKAEPELKQRFIQEFTAAKYLDDTKFTLWFSELLKRRAKSDRAIRAELFKKGIDREIVESCLGEEGDDEQARLKKVISKKQKLSRYQKDPQKLMRYLVAQGFSWPEVKQALKSNSDT